MMFLLLYVRHNCFIFFLGGGRDDWENEEGTGKASEVEVDGTFVGVSIADVSLSPVTWSSSRFLSAISCRLLMWSCRFVVF
jgi:hypothetical protein